MSRASQPYPAALRALQVARSAAATTVEQVCRLDTCVGQTVYHWTDPDAVLGTLPIGQPAWAAGLQQTHDAIADSRSRGR